jgi:hypothetical protein
MKKLLLLCGIVLGCGEIIAQPNPAIEFSFDVAGNRIKRFLSVEDGPPPGGNRYGTPIDSTSSNTNAQYPPITSSSELLQVTAYPNPTEGLVFVTIEGYQGLNPKPNYVLSDGNGKIVSTQNILSPTCQINMTELANGTYFLRVISGEKSKSFIINKKS